MLENSLDTLFFLEGIKRNLELINEMISREMFDSIIREVEKIGVPKESLELVKVYKILYLGPGEIKAGEVFGTIEANDAVNNYQYLYNVEKDGKDVSGQSIQPGEDIILTGSTEGPISFKGFFMLFFDLFGMFVDSFDYPSYRADPGLLNVPVTRPILSKDYTRSLMVRYAVFENAMIAKLKVNLYRDDGATVNVFGIVASSTSTLLDAAYSSDIFHNKPNDTIQIKSGGELPFSRSIIAVPLNSNLILHCRLCSSTEDHTIYQGRLEFKAQKNGVTSEEIFCNRGRILLEITWQCQE